MILMICHYIRRFRLNVFHFSIGCSPSVSELKSNEKNKKMSVARSLSTRMTKLEIGARCASCETRARVLLLLVANRVRVSTYLFRININNSERRKKMYF